MQALNRSARFETARCPQEDPRGNVTWYPSRLEDNSVYWWRLGNDGEVETTFQEPAVTAASDPWAPMEHDRAATKGKGKVQLTERGRGQCQQAKAAAQQTFAAHLETQFMSADSEFMKSWDVEASELMWGSLGGRGAGLGMPEMILGGSAAATAAASFATTPTCTATVAGGTCHRATSAATLEVQPAVKKEPIVARARAVPTAVPRGVPVVVGAQKRLAKSTPAVAHMAPAELKLESSSDEEQNGGYNKRPATVLGAGPNCPDLGPPGSAEMSHKPMNGSENCMDTLRWRLPGPPTHARPHAPRGIKVRYRMPRPRSA